MYSSPQLKTLDIDHVLHPMSSIGMIKQEGPHILSSGNGVFVTDSDGNKFISADAGLGATTLGFGCQELGEAMLQASEEMGFYQTTLGSSNPAQIILAEKLLASMPEHITKVFFANSGSEANETAIKLLRFYNILHGKPSKRKIITQELSYHGATIATAALTGIEDFHHDFGVHRDDVISVACPSYSVFSRPDECESSFTQRLIDDLENRIQVEGEDNIAGFLAEPILGCSGAIVPPADYYEKVQVLLNKYNIKFICDEVLCGYGRTGKMFGYEHFNIKADIITSAKGLTSGYFPLSAVALSHEIWQSIAQSYDNFGVFRHGFTSSGHPIGAAVALKTLNMIEELDIIENARLRGEELLEGLREALRDHPFVREIRGKGLLVAVALGGVNKGDRKRRDSQQEVDKMLLAHTESCCRARGLLLRSATTTNASYLVPPLIVNTSEIEQIVELYRLGLNDAVIAL